MNDKYHISGLNLNYEWLKFVEPGDILWLVKEEKYAVIKSKYMPGSRRMGTIGLCVDGRDVVWYVSKYGEGADGSLLMSPAESKAAIIARRYIESTNNDNIEGN